MSSKNFGEIIQLTEKNNKQSILPIQLDGRKSKLQMTENVLRNLMAF